MSCALTRQTVPQTEIEIEQTLSWNSIAEIIRKHAGTLDPDASAELSDFADLLDDLAELEQSQSEAQSIGALASSSRAR